MNNDKEFDKLKNFILRVNKNNINNDSEVICINNKNYYINIEEFEYDN